MAAATGTGQRELLSRQRSQAQAQLIRTIFSQKGEALVPLTSEAELQQLRDAVAKARLGPDLTAEMTAILRLNGAVLNQSFDELLTTVARAWIMFSPVSAFNDVLRRRSVAAARAAPYPPPPPAGIGRASQRASQGYGR